MNERFSGPAMARERGVTLIVVMLILTVVMIIGIGGAQLSMLGERSTRYDRDYLVATQAAEAALMDAEFDIAGPNTASNNRMALFTQTNLGIFKDGCGTSGTSLGLCNPVDTDLVGLKPVWQTVDFDSTTGPTVPFGQFTGRSFKSALSGGAGIQPALPPRYIIEVVDDKSPKGDASVANQAKMYRITAIGFGPRQDIQVVMQSAFRKKL